jgi:hypothetical protein
MLNCLYCKKEFKLKQNVKRHQDTCKLNENNNKKDYKCKVCSKTYTTKWYFEDHVIKCKPKKKALEKNIKDTIKKEIQEAFKNVETKNVYNVNIKNYIQKNVFMNGLEPIDLSQDRFDNIVDTKYTYEVHKKVSLVPDVIVPFFSNEKGEVVAMLSDRSRMKIKCIDSRDLKIKYHDSQSLVDMCKASKPLITKRQEYIDTLNNEPNYIDVMDKNPTNYFIGTDNKYMEKFLKKCSGLFIDKKNKDEQKLPQPDSKGNYYLDQVEKISYSS